ncbi:hypothetical protein [Archangium violaceum]|uniref:Phasin domain-containing protein n=1 Tax=Archangium violaceum Cb vi76 TaxID=1406225 RepID=A0A084SHM6_9BACT|nr:hypothetical protein [Archangium violaceum]KFA87961.1 hypothetical protein Q664_44360 [Archangium violaceum Cb vi76]
MAAAYQQLMHSTVKMVEDTGEQLRQLATLSTAASGVALRLMLSGEKPQQSAQAMAQAQQSLQQATEIFQQIGQVSTRFLERLQPPLPAQPAPAPAPAAVEASGSDTPGKP